MHQEDKPAAPAATDAAGPDIQKLEDEGAVSPAGQGAAKAAEEYLGAPAPVNEKERHETLSACQILDTPPDPRFDDITKLVGLIVLIYAQLRSSYKRSHFFLPCPCELQCACHRKVDKSFHLQGPINVSRLT